MRGGMSNLIFHTTGNVAGLLLRLTVAGVMFPHGAQKLFGWFGGYGPSGTLQHFRSLGVPTVAGWIGILAEAVGPGLLVLGLGTRGRSGERRVGEEWRSRWASYSLKKKKE